MHTRHGVRPSIAALFVVAGIWYAVAGGAERIAAGAPAPQQGGGAASVNAPRLFQDLTTRRTQKCAVHDPSAEAQLAIEQDADVRGTAGGGIVDIPVYWHIVTSVAGGGNVQGLVPAQMQVLNDAFAPSRFTFRLAGIDVTANDTWFFAELGSPAEVQMKAALRRGGPQALNIYTTNGDVYLGWATFPAYYKRAPLYDGVVVWWAALPGTGLAGPDPQEPDGILTYDEGDTGTHEVGHWLGLYHTFQGGCSHPNDKVKDTPAEAEPQFFCAPRDSCVGPAFRGVDPIMNYMDYVDDVCMTHFTSDQTKQMQKHWHAFRDKKARN
jgi:hypothetical protein